MDCKKELKTQKTIQLLESRLHIVEEKANGHIRVKGCDYWCTTEKGWNPKTNQKTLGLRNFIIMIESEE